MVLRLRCCCRCRCVGGARQVPYILVEPCSALAPRHPTAASSRDRGAFSSTAAAAPIEGKYVSAAAAVGAGAGAASASFAGAEAGGQGEYRGLLSALEEDKELGEASGDGGGTAVRQEHGDGHGHVPEEVPYEGEDLLMAGMEEGEEGDEEGGDLEQGGQGEGEEEEEELDGKCGRLVPVVWCL